MSTADPTHRNDEFHRGLIPVAQLASGTATAGYVPVSGGPGTTATWTAASGGGSNLTAVLTAGDSAGGLNITDVAFVFGPPGPGPFVVEAGDGPTTGDNGGGLFLSGGFDGNAGAGNPAALTLPGSTTTGGSGKAQLTSDNVTGSGPQVIASDGSGNAVWTTQTVRHAAGVPSGAPGVGELPIAFDSTAITGGVYYWTGAAWVKGGTI